MIFGAIEAGGTKFVLAIGTKEGKIIDKKTIKTRGPEETMFDVVDYFKDKDIKSLGVGCFGPLELDKDSNMYGYITTAPKEKWVNYDILGNLKAQLKVPVSISTDVSAAALGEVTFGKYKNSNTLLYITIGTGIGGGYVIDKKIHNGMLHPEMGHVLVKKNINDKYEGNCRFHGTCLESLASGPAIEGRTKLKGIEIPEDHESWMYVADYISQAIVNYILVLSPTNIILGGGVMDRKFLYPLIRKNVKELLNGYIVAEELEDMDNYVVEPSLGSSSGILGALALGINEIKV